MADQEYGQVTAAVNAQVALPGIFTGDGLARMFADMLSDACGSDTPDQYGFNVYVIDTHCVRFVIKARPIEGYHGWEVVYVQKYSI